MEREGRGGVLDRLLKVSINPDLIDKNDAEDSDLFVRGFKNVEVSPEELATAVGEGMAFCCQLAGNYRNSGNFLNSDVLSIDIDGDLRLDELDQNEFIQRHLTLLYTTPSHTELQHRFRLVFALERTVETAAEMQAALRSLTLKLGGDRSATDPARISFGSSGSVPQVFDRQIDSQTLDDLIEQGLDSDRSDSARTYKVSTTISRLRISSDDPVKVAGGDVVAFGKILHRTRVHCPFHYDRTPSAFVTTTRDGKTCLHCSTCNQTFFQPGGADQHDFDSFDTFIKRAHEYFLTHRDYGPFFPDAKTHPGLTGTTLHLSESEKLQIPLLEPGLTLIKSPKGSGKTKALEHLLENRTTLLIGHRRSLIGQTCGRLKLANYLDYEKGPIRQARLGICLDSLGRLAGTADTVKHDVVVIDESEQVLSHFLADTLTKGESSKSHRLFQIFQRILRNAKYVIALDADLGWTTFETLRRIVTYDGTKDVPIHLYANHHQSGRKIQIFESDTHLIEDICESLIMEKRVFVTSNSKRRVHAIEKAIKAQVPMLDSIAITSDTVDRDDVRAFIKAAPAEALKYQLILTSPTLGTGVDITFDKESREIDVVYGFCEPLITTHLDFDQQIARVRHPKQTKVWLTPRVFNFHTSREVIRSDLHKQGIFSTLLQDYDEQLNPTFSEHSSFVEMASLAVSQQRASKNQLLNHYAAYKRRQGCKIEIVPEDDAAAEKGMGLLKAGYELAAADRVDQLMNAKTLRYGEFETMSRRMKLAKFPLSKKTDNEAEDAETLEGPPTEHERWRMLKTVLELFYRQRLTPELIEADNYGKTRHATIEFAHLLALVERRRKATPTLRELLSSKMDMLSRFLRDRNRRTALVYDLLSKTPIFREGEFSSTPYDNEALAELARAIEERKPEFENLLGIEVPKDLRLKSAKTFGSFLKVIGLRQAKAGTVKSGEKKIYRYKVDMDSLTTTRSLVDLRARRRGWETLYYLYDWDKAELHEYDPADAIFPDEKASETL